MFQDGTRAAPWNKVPGAPRAKHDVVIWLQNSVVKKAVTHGDIPARKSFQILNFFCTADQGCSWFSPQRRSLKNGTSTWEVQV